MKSGLRLFLAGPDERAIRENQAVEIMATDHTEAMEKGLALNALGLLILGESVTVELYVTDGTRARTFTFEPSPIDCPDWIERNDTPPKHPLLWPLLDQLEHEAHWQASHTKTTTTEHTISL